MSDKYVIIAGIAIANIFFWVVVFPLARLREKKKFNNGVCKCGGELHFSCSDSQGGMCFTCKKCNLDMWISWFSPGINPDGSIMKDKR